MIIGLVGLSGAALACGPQPGAAGSMFGEWRVASHAASYVSAMSDEEADAWVGRRASYAPSRVSFHDAVCDRPTFTPGTWTAGAFAARYQIQPSELDLPAGEVGTVEIGCPGSWTVPGAVLVLAGGRMFAPWDGVFFELRRVGNPR